MVSFKTYDAFVAAALSCYISTISGGVHNSYDMFTIDQNDLTSYVES